ncbi:MAG: DUF6807 family protein, partial [Opitutaceae bacterium]
MAGGGLLGPGEPDQPQLGAIRDRARISPAHPRSARRPARPHHRASPRAHRAAASAAGSHHHGILHLREDPVVETGREHFVGDLEGAHEPEHRLVSRPGTQVGPHAGAARRWVEAGVSVALRGILVALHRVGAVLRERAVGPAGSARAGKSAAAGTIRRASRRRAAGAGGDASAGASRAGTDSADEALLRELPSSGRVEALGELALDHYHHRGIWFGHENINGVNSWTERGTSTNGLPDDQLNAKQ